MNTKRLRFIAEYAVDGNASAAARRAGYSARCASVTACRLLRDASVRALVAEHEQAAAERLGVSREQVLSGLMEAVEVARAQGDPGAMNRAWAEIGKLLGYYKTERVQVDLHVNVATKRLITELETRSDAELLAIVAGGSES